MIDTFSVSPTAIANFADRRDWRIKSPITSISDTSDLKIRHGSQTIKFTAA